MRLKHLSLPIDLKELEAHLRYRGKLDSRDVKQLIATLRATRLALLAVVSAPTSKAYFQAHNAIGLTVDGDE
jgi:hypothetical protein